MVMGKTVHILLVEDDDIDAEAVIRAFRKNRVANPFFIARDGVEALEMLRGENGRERLPRPYLILLDLNMPRMSGIEFLGALRSDPDLRNSLVFVLTTSKRDEDIVSAYDRNIAGYLVKSDVFDDFLELINLLESYWRVIEFPPERNG